MLCRKRKMNLQTDFQNKPPATANVAFSTRNSADNAPELDHYVYECIDEPHNDQPNVYEQLAADNPQVPSPSYDVLGPDYLRIIG